MPEQMTATSPGSRDAGAEVAELRAELAESREEVLRLRDLLIGKEAELGALRGRVSELESGADPVVMVAARLRALLPGSLRSVLARLLRRARS